MAIFTTALTLYAGHVHGVYRCELAEVSYPLHDQPAHKGAQPWVATMVHTVCQQPSSEEVHVQLERVAEQLSERFPDVSSMLAEAGTSVLSFTCLPPAHWKQVWSNNLQERPNKEIRRRTDIVGIFPNRSAARRLIGAVLAEQHDEWAVARRYLTPRVGTKQEALPEVPLTQAAAA